MSDTDGRRWHDMGGQQAGPIDPAGHDHALWEKRVDALLVLCGKNRHRPAAAPRLRRATTGTGL